MRSLQQQRNDFAELSNKVQSLIRHLPWHKVYGWEFLKLGLRLALFILGFFILATQTWYSIGAGLILMAYAHGSIAISGIHESRHQSFCKSYWGNRVLAYLFSDFWVGQSNEWWHDTHVLIHHPNTNIPSIDPPSFYFPWINRYMYFLIVPFFAIIWLNIKSAIYLWHQKTKLILFVITAIAGWAFHIALFNTVLPLGWSIVCAYLLRSLFAPIFVHLAVFNHVGLETPATRYSWLYHQLQTTRNIRKNWFLTGLGGNAFVECHTEHHLFPNISNHVLNKIRPLVQSFALKHNYPYFEEGYMTVLKAAIRDYDQVFSIVKAPNPSKG